MANEAPIETGDDRVVALDQAIRLAVSQPQAQGQSAVLVTARAFHAFLTDSEEVEG